MDNASPQFDDLLRSWGFDPEKYYILNDTIRVSTWDELGKGDVQQAWAYKAQIIYREHALIKMIMIVYLNGYKHTSVKLNLK